MLTAILLTISNVFMTYAWYYHLKNPWLKTAPVWIVVMASWAIAFFEYCFQVPGNRFGARTGLSAAQLKIMQEAITLLVFCIFAKVVLKEELAWNHYVGFCFVLVGVFFVFHFKQPAAPNIAKKTDQTQVTALPSAVPAD